MLVDEYKGHAECLFVFYVRLLLEEIISDVMDNLVRASDHCRG